MAELKNLTLEIKDRVAVVTVNRPQVLNALNAETLNDLESAFQNLQADDAVGAVILTGAGDKAFIAGADISELARLDSLSAKAGAARGQRVLDMIEGYPKPVIAAINGFALGGGCELALACHLRIGSESARLGQPEVKLGIIPGYGGTQRLPRLVGKGRALELILTGEMISAAEAEKIGLLNRVVPAAELMDTSRSLAAKMLHNGPLALRYAIEAVNNGLEMGLQEGLSLEATLFGICFATRDMKEGTTAFLEKRKADFQGQ